MSTENSARFKGSTTIRLAIGRRPQGVLCLSVDDKVRDREHQAERVGIVYEGGLGEVPLLSQGGQVSLLLGRGDGGNGYKKGSSVLHYLFGLVRVGCC